MSSTLPAELAPESTTPRVGRGASRLAVRQHRIDSRRRWFPDLQEFAQGRDLLTLLSRRQVTLTYRQTALGPAWVILSPLMSAGLFTFVFGRVAHLANGGTPYFAFSYAGLLGWNLFASTLQGTATSLTANSALISKIYFSRLILPVSTLGAVLVQLVVSLLVMTGLLLAYGLGFSVHLLLLPVWLLLALTLAVGVGLVLTAISVTYRDVNNLTPAIVPLFLYLTPVAYPTAAVPGSLRELFLINPVATIVEGCRWSVLGHGYLSGGQVLYAVLFTLAVLVAGLVVFARLEWNFADVI